MLASSFDKENAATGQEIGGLGKERAGRSFGVTLKTPGPVAKRHGLTPGLTASKIGALTPSRRALGDIKNFIHSSGTQRIADSGILKDGLVKSTAANVEKAKPFAGQENAARAFTPPLNTKKLNKQAATTKLQSESTSEVNQRSQDVNRRRAEQYAEEGIELVHFPGDSLQALLKEEGEREIDMRVRAVSKAVLSCRTPWPTFQFIERESLDGPEELPMEPMPPLGDDRDLQYHIFHSAPGDAHIFGDEDFDASLLPDLGDDFNIELARPSIEA
eukprot:TRINITY_DN15252_c0_g1_i2.p1 TRINITY_DN15252_c0_g1~~TRINITY_DN15252_c0_g1_i2.p1  ORF type:complete len:274 (+),score=50.80 TRINITY_DN15252_c0_g1_i2:129-950(+)